MVSYNTRFHFTSAATATLQPPGPNCSRSLDRARYLNESNAEPTNSTCRWAVNDFRLDFTTTLCKNPVTDSDPPQRSSSGFRMTALEAFNHANHASQTVDILISSVF